MLNKRHPALWTLWTKGRCGLSATVVLILFASRAVASAQETTAMVSGQIVRASSGEPVVGVHVAVLGTEMETTSAEKGWYIMFNVPPGKHRVQASMVGFETVTKVVTLHAGGALLLEFELAEDPVPLDDVIITESDSRRQFGNSVASVDSKVFEVTAVADINAVLRDLVAGVHGTAASGQVGTGASIRVRGPTSVTQRTEPVIYLDGVRLVTRGVPGPQGTGQAVNILDVISPEDIARIRVLRGASATAQYGMNSGSGVILIYTKRGNRPN
jgi:TonB-dependent SusC/RagA subfamily outer membrane receptor